VRRKVSSAYTVPPCTANRGCAPTILNAANEIAVEEFLCHRIGFGDIARVIDLVMEQATRENMLKNASDLREIATVDAYGRRQAQSVIKKLQARLN